MKKLIKKFYSHPMSWFVTFYVLGFTIATILFGWVGLIHPAGTLIIVGGFLLACKPSKVG